jgi:hypothetical protein
MNAGMAYVNGKGSFGLTSRLEQGQVCAVVSGERVGEERRTYAPMQSMPLRFAQ